MLLEDEEDEDAEAAEAEAEAKSREAKKKVGGLFILFQQFVVAFPAVQLLAA